MVNELQAWKPVRFTTTDAVRFDRDETSLSITGAGQLTPGGYWESPPMPVTNSDALEFITSVSCDGDLSARAAKALLLWKADDGVTLAIEHLIGDGRGARARALRLVAQAPDGAVTVTLLLLCAEISSGTVRWSAPVIRKGVQEQRRTVVAASARLPLSEPATLDANLTELVNTLASMSGHRPDLVCLPEMCASWGVAGSPRDVAISRDRFLTALSTGARAARSNVVAAFYEAVDGDIYNTALLVDRTGQLIGEYRKTHLTALETLAGVRAGRTLNVFQTDIGVVGMVICWDMWHPEPARLAALQGADILLWPYEQDRHSEHREHTPLVRAMDNGIVIIGASQQTPAPIVDADGQLLAQLDGPNPVYAEVEIGGAHRGQRWPQVAPRGSIRRNLLEEEQNPIIAREISILVTGS